MEALMFPFYKHREDKLAANKGLAYNQKVYAQKFNPTESINK